MGGQQTMNARLRQLNPEECRQLIVGGGVGRVAFRAPSGQQIITVNFELCGDSIVLRTTPYTELGRHGPGREAAFEVDALDREQRSGWSVVARGRLHMASTPAQLAEIRTRRDPQPWPEGVRSLYLTLRWDDITGRRLEPAAPSTGSAARLTGGRALPIGPWTARGTVHHVRRAGQPARY
jgi:uncharacterized protein